MEKGWTKVYETSDTYLGGLAHGLLDDSGITVVEMNHRDSSYLDVLEVGIIELYVEDKDVADASEILKQIKIG